MRLDDLSDALSKVDRRDLEALKNHILDHSDVFLIGNGGSNAIASHMAVDYSKFLNKKCYVPNASDLMSMIVNDYGRDAMFSKFIELYHEKYKSQLAILVSSSGNSSNILNAYSTCKNLDIPVIILSGFEFNNSLNTIESSNILLKFWVDSKNYGVVEMTHHSILHSVV